MSDLNKLFFFAVAIALFTNLTWAGENVDKKGLAVKGYDLVSYFSDAAPKKGVNQNGLTRIQTG